MSDPRKKLAQTYGDAWYEKSRKKRQKLLATELFFDFTSNTTLHGLRYITQRGLSIIEKIFWLIIFLTSVGMSFYLIRNVYIKWRNSPVIVSVSEKLVPVAMVPFPSITICPQTKCKATLYNYTAERIAYYKYAKELRSGNETAGSDNLIDYESIETFEDISMLCERGLHYVSGQEFTNSSRINNMLLVSPNLSDIFMLCTWRNTDMDCGQIFDRVLTAEGVCYNMNSLAASEIFRIDEIQSNYDFLSASVPNRSWSVDGGYSDDKVSQTVKNTPNPYPRRGRENGASPDLEVILRQDTQNLDGFCNSIKSGYTIYVQHPTDLPQSSLYYYAALPKQVSSFALSFNVLNTSESLADYPADIRQCYFPHERYLRYFRIYTASNCRMECLSNYTLKYCNCVGYYMPHDNSSRICGSKKMQCIMEAQEHLADEEIKSSSNESDACRCLPACNSIDYEAEILKTDYNIETYIKAVFKSEETPLEFLKNNQLTKIEMYFKRPRFLSMRRSELFGTTDFLANCGGLLGLFLGFSFLSLVEIFYFLTLRLCCTLKRDLKEEKTSRKTKTEHCS